MRQKVYFALSILSSSVAPSLTRSKLMLSGWMASISSRTGMLVPMEESWRQNRTSSISLASVALCLPCQEPKTVASMLISLAAVGLSGFFRDFLCCSPTLYVSLIPNALCWKSPWSSWWMSSCRPQPESCWPRRWWDGRLRPLRPRCLQGRLTCTCMINDDQRTGERAEVKPRQVGRTFCSKQCNLIGVCV